MKMGFVVNPIAGMGGRVGLKGTDGVYYRALKLGGRRVAPLRAVEFLVVLKKLDPDSLISIVTCPGIMGEAEIKASGLEAFIVRLKLGKETTAEDTKEAVRRMMAHGVDLVVFVGGDGTARDVLDALRSSNGDALVLGVPSGVKMYSGIFAVNPIEAANLVWDYVQGRCQQMDLEIMDADEEAIRSGQFSISLYGYLKGPYVPMRLQGSKQVSPATVDERENQEAVARFVVEEMDPEATYILGPGTTVASIARLLHFEKTLLGVDIYRGGKVIRDVNEDAILQEVEDWERTWIVVSPIGRQGMIFGRGNQQVSPEIIRLVGRERIIVAATHSKLSGISAGSLWVDTGDPKVDEYLRGHMRVAVDYREWLIVPVR